MTSPHPAHIQHGDYLFNKEMLFDIPVELHVCRFGDRTAEEVVTKIESIKFNNPDAFKVYLNCNEPSSSPCRETIPNVLAYAHKYDLILTSDIEILQGADNAKLFPFGTTWLNKGSTSSQENGTADELGIYDEQKVQPKCKNFEVSFLVSLPKNNIKGYDMRREVWDKQYLISSMDKKFYASTRYALGIKGPPLPDDDKKHLFESQYSIVMESSQVHSYFSEKLIDALITKTIPIYWGCRNIGEFFDTQGIIMANSADDVIRKVNSITPSVYEDRKAHIDKNFEIAKEYARYFGDRVKEAIDSYLLESGALASQ